MPVCRAIGAQRTWEDYFSEETNPFEAVCEFIDAACKHTIDFDRLVNEYDGGMYEHDDATRAYLAELFGERLGGALLGARPSTPDLVEEAGQALFKECLRRAQLYKPNIVRAWIQLSPDFESIIFRSQYELATLLANPRRGGTPMQHRARTIIGLIATSLLCGTVASAQDAGGTTALPTSDIDPASYAGTITIGHKSPAFVVKLERGDTIVETLTVSEKLNASAATQVGQQITGDNGYFSTGERTITVTRVLKKSGDDFKLHELDAKNSPVDLRSNTMIEARQPRQ